MTQLPNLCPNILIIVPTKGPSTIYTISGEPRSCRCNRGDQRVERLVFRRHLHSRFKSVVRVTGSDHCLFLESLEKVVARFVSRKTAGSVRIETQRSLSEEQPDETCYLICRGGEGSTIIYSQPRIDERRVPGKVAEEWESQQCTLAECRLAFQAVECRRYRRQGG